MRRRVLAVLAAWGTTGCYYFQPLGMPNPQPGTYLAATLNDDGAERLSRTIGPDVREVRGHLLTSDDHALTLSVLGVSLHHGESITWKGERVTVSRGFLSGLQQRRLSHGRTILMVGATILGVVTTYKVFQGLWLTPGGGGSGPQAK
jgi:hypothetical protein